MVHAAQAVVSDSAVFPTDRATTQVDLPDDWSRSRPGSAGPVWYRVSFSAPGLRESGDLLALYIEHVCTNLEVYLNGQLVHSGGRMSEPITQNCNQPQLVSLPAALIAPGLNALDLKVVGHPLARVASTHRAGGLSALEIGPKSVLEPKHARQLALNVAVPQAISATLAADGRLHVRARLDQPAREPPGLLRRAVGRLGDRRIAPVAARPAFRKRHRGIPAVRDAAAADAGRRAVPAALCQPPQPLDRPVAAAAMRADAGEPGAGRAGSAVPDGQLLVRAAGAAGAGRGRLLPAHPVPRAPALVLADGAAAVHGQRGAGRRVRWHRSSASARWPRSWRRSPRR